MEIKNIFVKRVAGTIIMLLKKEPSTITNLAKRGDITYARVEVVLKILISFNIIKIEKEGRKCNCSLTEKGNEVAAAIDVLKEFNRE